MSSKTLARLPPVPKALTEIAMPTSTDEIMIYPKWMEPIPVTMLLLEKNGWWRDKSNTNAFIHPQLGTDNKIVFKNNVPVFHNVQIPYVHQLQNVLHEHNENISIHMQIFKI